MVSGVRCMVMRGGTSKGAYFLAEDLPSDLEERDDLLLRIMGSPDECQIDGVGGADPLTSKVAVISPSPDDHADVDYLFLQVGVDTPTVTDHQNCGNLLAGVAPFAIERGLVDPSRVGTGPTYDAPASAGGAVIPINFGGAFSGEVAVRIRMLNTGGVATARFAVDDGLPIYRGDAAISGVPGTAAPVWLEFADVAGGSCGALLPTGNVIDVIDGISVTLIDNGMPVVVISATDMGISGTESCAELEANNALRERLESIRLQAGHLMNLGNVADLIVPKLSMVSTPSDPGNGLATRTFIPHRCHNAIGVLGAVSVATAAVIPGSAAHSLVGRFEDDTLSLEHPSGTFDAVVALGPGPSGPTVRRAGILRTTRLLMDGLVYPR
jgi:4-oxalomesaconate tautomerase